MTFFKSANHNNFLVKSTDYPSLQIIPFEELFLSPNYPSHRIICVHESSESSKYSIRDSSYSILLCHNSSWLHSSNYSSRDSCYSSLLCRVSSYPSLFQFLICRFIRSVTRVTPTCLNTQKTPVVICFLSWIVDYLTRDFQNCEYSYIP